MVNDSVLTAGIVLLAILAGSFPSGVVLSRIFLDRDIREVGSGNIGAANAARAGGIKLGVGVACLDILKGVLPLLLGRWLGLDAIGLSIAALATVLGHDFSIFLHFKGGKGVATTLGAAVVLAPIAAVLAALCWVLTLLLRGYTSLASLVSLALLPVFVAITRQPPAFVVVTALLFVLAAIKHVENISRLLSGTERSFRQRPARGD